jgi:tripartite-type tricarboxylate transporter receptor subunit TctC
MIRRIAVCTAIATGTLLGINAATDAQTFPSRPITMVVPFSPGGLTDSVMRMVGQGVSESLGQPFVVENKPTGAGTVGAMAVKQAAPDGYTLFFGHTGTHAVNPAIMSKVPYDPVKDFQPITNLISSALILVVPADSPAKSVKELVELAKTKSGGLNYASQGIGTAGHVAGEMFRASTKADMTHVPYRGGAPAAVDTVAGRVDLLFSSYLTVNAMLKDNRLRVLAITSERRSPVLPDVPTMAEAGFPGVQLDGWYGVLAPAGTPDPVVRKLSAEFVKAVRSPQVSKYVADQATDVVASTPEEFAAVIAKDAVRLGSVMKAAGVKLD